MATKKHQLVHVQFPVADHHMIKRAAEKEGRTVSSYIRFHVLKASEKTLYFSEPVPGQNEIPIF